MNCKKCGCILPEGVTCCPSCGTFAQTQPTNQMSQEQIPQQPGMTQQPVANKSLIPGQGTPIQNNINNQTTNSQSTYEEEPKKKKNIFKILILLIIVAAAGVFLYPKIKAMLYKTKISSTDKLYETTSFWLPNNDEKVAIFNINGE